MFKGVWGYDVVKKSYWYYVEYMGVEVEGARGLTRKEWESVKAKSNMTNWFKDTDFAY